MKAKTRKTLQPLLEIGQRKTINTNQLTKAFLDAGATVEQCRLNGGLTVRYNNRSAFIVFIDGDNTKCKSPRSQNARYLIQKMLN